MDEKPPRNLKAMLSEAKDASELMVDLAYAALFFADEHMAAEVHELEERLSGLVHEMREVCVLAARSPRDAEEMSSVLHVIAAMERVANAAEDIARIVTHRLGIPAALAADLDGEAGSGERPVSERRVGAHAHAVGDLLGGGEIGDQRGRDAQTVGDDARDVDGRVAHALDGREHVEHARHLLRVAG